MDKWLQSNMFAKIFAFMLAVLLWLVVSAEDPTVPSRLTEHEFKVPVTYNLDETQFTIINATENVDVILSGNPADIRTVFPGSLRVVADLTDLGPGSHSNIPIIVEGVPRGVSWQTRPNLVNVELAKKTTIEMPVQIVLQGVAAPGFTAGQPIVSPSRIFVTGTEDQLAALASVSAYVNIANARSVIDETVRVRAVDSQGNELQVEINPAVVDVVVPVSSPFKELPLSFHYDGFPAQGFAVSNIQLSLDQVTIFGPMQEIDRYEFFPGPAISIEGIRETTTIEQRLEPLYGTTKIEPEIVIVTVEVVPSQTNELKNVPIIINGMGDNIKVTLDYQHIDLAVEGAPNRLNNLTVDDIQVFIDVSNKALGVHTVPIQINTPRFIRPFNMERNQVTVTIERR